MFHRLPKFEAVVASAIPWSETRKKKANCRVQALRLAQADDPGSAEEGEFAISCIFNLTLILANCQVLFVFHAESNRSLQHASANSDLDFATVQYTGLWFLNKIVFI